MAEIPGFNRGITFADFHMAGMRPVSMDAAIRRERNILAWRPKCFKWSDAIPSFAIALEFDIFLMAESISSSERISFLLLGPKIVAHLRGLWRGVDMRRVILIIITDK